MTRKAPFFFRGYFAMFNFLLNYFMDIIFRSFFKTAGFLRVENGFSYLLGVTRPFPYTTFRQRPCQPKIANHHLALFAYQNIRGLEVAVDYIA
jgi:hypothetical protein